MEVYLDKAKVCVTGIAIEREEMVNKLALMGYPEKGNNNLLSRAKSYISCAVGNLNDKKKIKNETGDIY